MTVETFFTELESKLDAQILEYKQRGADPPIYLLEMRSYCKQSAGNNSSTNGSANPLAVDEIKTAVGAKEDETTTYLGDDRIGSISWSIVSLLRGLFWQIDQILGGYLSISVSISGTPSIQIDPKYSYTTDYSGVITTPDESFVAITRYDDRSWLLLQNHGKLNNEKGIYEGDLWVNFSTDTLAPVSNKGYGSYKIPPGQNLSFESSMPPQGSISLLGTVAGMEYTLKEGT